MVNIISLKRPKTVTFNNSKLVSNTFDARDNCPLLNGRWLLKTIGIYSPQKSLLQVHVIEVVGNLSPVALKEKTMIDHEP